MMVNFEKFKTEWKRKVGELLFKIHLIIESKKQKQKDSH